MLHYLRVLKVYLRFGECVSVAVHLVSEQGQGSYKKLLLHVSSGGVYLNHYFRYCFRFYREIILHFLV